MLHGRKLLILLLLTALGAVVIVLTYRHAKIPEVVRLLPEGDRLAYANLKPLRLFWDLSKSTPSTLDAGYRDFIQRTGIQFERDLDEAALSWRETVTGGSRKVESAAIFVARFDSSKLSNYLQEISTQKETYRGRNIYTILNGDHTVRVCVLDGKRIAVSNAGSAATTHDIIDNARTWPSGPELLRRYYRSIPTGSLAWMISRIRSDSALPSLGTNFDFLENTEAVASLRYNGSLLLRADIFAASDSDAKKIMESTNAFLTLYGFLDRSAGIRKDADFKEALNSIRLEQEGKVVTLTARCSERLLQRLQSQLQPEAGRTLH